MSLKTLPLAQVSAFWQGALTGAEAPTPLTIERSRRDEPRTETARAGLSEPESAQVTAFAESLGIGVRTLFAGAWALVLGRYADREEVVFGMSAPGGSVLPRRVRLGNETCSSWLLQLEAQLSTEDLHAADLRQICEWAGLDARSALTSAVHFEGGTAVCDVPLAMRVGVAAVSSVSVEYAGGRFEPDAIVRMLLHVRTLLANMTASGEAKLHDLEMLPEQERTRLLVQFNDTAHDFPREKCFHHLVEERVESAPDAPALVFAGRTLSYRELNQRANQLAHYLRSLGVGPDVRVGIFADRSVEMVVGILGILKAGGAFTPLDPKYPAERLAFMMEDAGASVLLTQERLLGGLEGSPTKNVALDREWPRISRESTANPDVAMDPENLAYVIYTSGSTGRPKGVAIRHRGSVNNVYDLNTRFDVGPADRMLVLSSLSFDMCVYEVLGTLLAGAAMIMPLPARAQDPAHWAELVREHGVTVWNSAPQLLEMLVDHTEGRPEIHPRSLRLAILGGDWVPVTLPDRFRTITADGSKVVVLGGATECSIHSTIYVVERTDPDWQSIPYGRPQWNQSCFVLDSRRRLCPIGVPGELHLGGEGLGRGYLDRPELTEQKFIPHPFSDVPGNRLYRTGDLVRMDDTGLLTLLGRIDFMVKIRGFRIELGEIEALLRSHESVREAVVVAKDDERGDRRLVAYVLPSAASEPADLQSTTHRVGRWQEIYELAYTACAEAPADPTFNIAGWNSSYTGAPIPADDMKQWVDTTVERIAALHPRRVLEIGCGTGLLLFRLAGKCERYVGADFSQAAIDHVERHKAAYGLDHVETVLREASDFTGFEPGSFDLVVLNSIVLQFPDVRYVVDVLQDAAKVLAPGGAIFIGDVRHLPTLGVYHTSVQLAQAAGDTTRSQLRQRIDQRIRQEEELLMDPAFFQALVEQTPELERCVVQVKRGRYLNELSKYRYDATLFAKAPEARPAPTVSWIDWSDGSHTLDDLRGVAEQGQADVIVLTGVPNARLKSDVVAADLVWAEDGPDTVAGMRDLIAARSPETKSWEPEDVHELSGLSPYRVDLRLGSNEAAGRFDVVLQREPRGGETSSAAFSMQRGREARTLEALVNDPMRLEKERDLVPRLRRHVARSLPDYMVPNAFVVLDRFPLTPNGKIDRKALPQPDLSRSALASGPVAPTDAVEQVLASIWAEVLGLDEVGITDGFFELGGHSLKATQIVSRVRDSLGVQVPLGVVLKHPTVRQMAEVLGKLAEEQRVRVADVAEVLLEVQALSDEEVGTLLAGHAGENTGREG
jgi:amino acid adenylation domain-containing protein